MGVSFLVLLTLNPCFAIHNRVPNAKEGRDSIELDIHGMVGVPDSDDEDAGVKKAKSEEGPTAADGAVPPSTTPATAVPTATPFIAAAPKPIISAPPVAVSSSPFGAPPYGAMPSR